MSLGARMFKFPSDMGLFPLPPPPLAANIAHINMISSFTSGSLNVSIDPRVVPRPEDFESYGASLLPIAVEILDMKIPSTSTDTSKELHPHMECDQPTSPVWVVYSLN